MVNKFLPTFLLCLSLSSAADKVPTITQHQLDVITTYWQRVLKLTDWEIRSSFVRVSDLGEGTIGESHISPLARTVSVHVLDPRDYAVSATENGTVPKVGKEIMRDIEDTIVHELVHVRLRELMKAEDHLATVEETTVNRITAGLLEVKHGK